MLTVMLTVAGPAQPARPGRRPASWASLGVILAGQGAILAGQGAIPHNQGVILAGQGAILAGQGAIPPSQGVILASHGCHSSWPWCHSS